MQTDCFEADAGADEAYALDPLFRLHVWGPRACFVRPEMHIERVTYDVMTPSAARGLLSSVYWSAGMGWRIERIHVLKPIRFREVGLDDVDAAALNRCVALGIPPALLHRSGIVLEDVSYVIEARMCGESGARDIGKRARHISRFEEQARAGESQRAASLGTRVCPAEFRLIETDEAMPLSEFPADPARVDLGWMFHDFDRRARGINRFFRAILVDGVLTVPPLDSLELTA